jgi:hypothetical protein
MADLLFAYHTPSEQSDTLLSLKSLMITSDSGAVSVYQVLSSNLVPGQRLEFIVVAPTRTAADSLKYSGQPAAEMVRIVISEAGVYEVRGTQATANRRKLLATPVGTLSGAYAGSITGQLASTASMACGESPAAPPKLLSPCNRHLCQLSRGRTSPSTALPAFLPACPPACLPASLSSSFHPTLPACLPSSLHSILSLLPCCPAGSGGASCSAAANSIGCPSVPTCGAGERFIAMCFGSGCCIYV